jgi:hypothetical protein
MFEAADPLLECSLKFEKALSAGGVVGGVGSP